MNLAESSNLLDVGFTGVDGFPSIQSCVDALAKKHEIRAAPSASRRAPHVAQTNYSQYRYLLHLPGAATGSYSRNLQYLWTQGSIVLVWNQTATEFYYRHLVNGEHYVVVDASNIVDTVEAIEADPARQERLRRGARAFYDAHLAAPRLIDRWRAVLEALAAGTAFPALGAAAAAPAAAAAAAPAAAPQTEPFQPLPRVPFDPSTIPTSGAPFEDVPATTMRKVIAKRLTESRAFVPHAFASVEADLAGVAKLRKHLMNEFGVKVSVNDVVIKAVALALRDVPRANSSWDGTTSAVSYTHLTLPTKA